MFSLVYRGRRDNTVVIVASHRSRIFNGLSRRDSPVICDPSCTWPGTGASGAVAAGSVLVVDEGFSVGDEGKVRVVVETEGYAPVTFQR